MKKKMMAMVLGVVLSMSLMACGSSETAEEVSSDSSTEETEDAESETEGETASSRIIDDTDRTMDYETGIARQKMEIVPKSEGEDITIGFACVMNDSMTYLFEAVETFDEENDDISITLVDTEGDISLEMSTIENFINMEVDAIILVPTDSTACDQISLKCTEAGIPIICTNSGMEAACWTMVGSDQYYAGQLQGEWLAENTDGTGNYCIVLGDLSNEASYARTNGVVDTLEEMAPEMNLLAQDDCGWMRDSAMEIAENWLNSDFADDINYIVSNNDEGAIGAAIACEAAGRDDILILGVDGLAAGLQYMDKGMLDFTVFQNVTAQGTTACETAVKVIRGEDVDTYIDVPMEPVTMENYKSYKTE